MTKIEELEWKLDTLTKMHKNAKEDFESISNELNECQKALAELKESKKEGKWKPVDGEKYWYRNDIGAIDFDEVCNTTAHDWQLKNLPIFKTKSECERYWHFMDTVKEKSYEFSKEEWEDGEIGKWRIIYDGEVKGFCVEANYLICVFDATYFKSREDAQYIINNFQDELMGYWI